MGDTPKGRMRGNALDFLGSGGEMSERIRTFDWSKTPLGPLERWPQSLKTALKIALNSRYPIWMGWGQDLIFLYNDPYIPVPGKRHEWALGVPAREVWKEIWQDHLGPQAEAVLLRGEASWNDQRQLIMYRNGYAEETYFTFSFSPLPADEGGIGGLFCACTEDTQKVLGERRLAALRHLAAATADARTEAEAGAIATHTLAAHDADVSFALIYLVAADGVTAQLAPGSRHLHDVRWAPPTISLTDHGGGGKSDSWPLRNAMKEGMQIVQDLAPELGLPGGRWPEATTLAAVVPLAKAGYTTVRGFLVVGASPRLPFNDNYKSFFELLARGTADALSNARAYEEERKRAEALAELDRAKTAFFSSVSHEFRTPLTLMLGPLEELLSNSHHDLPSSAQQHLEVIHRNGLRLLRLVNSLLDFSRLEAGRLQARYEPTDLAAMTADLASAFRSATERAGLKLLVDCPPSAERVYVDRDMWEKVVLNLLSNAFKFTFTGEIEVSVREMGQETPHVQLRVRDTGTGIPADALPHLFERFYRVEGAAGRTFEGSGIGLALVRELVMLHGGSVHVESVLGHGSTFTVTIPVGTAHLPQDRINAARTQVSTVTGAAPFVEEALRWFPDGASAKGEMKGSGAVTVGAQPDRVGDTADASRAVRPHLLIADDNADMREYIARLLATRYGVETVCDGEAALAAIQRCRPDLILSDIMMPRLDGVALLRAIRSDPTTKTIPVILLSAKAGEESRIEGMQGGADDYLVKPFSAKELLARVAAHVELAQLRQERERQLRVSDQQKTRLLYTVSHEYRSPLNAVVGISRILLDQLDGPLTSEQEKQVRLIHLGAQQLLTLVDTMLDLDRIKAGKLRVDPRPCQVASLLVGVRGSAGLFPLHPGVRLIVEEPTSLPDLSTDVTLLHRMLYNVVHNAAKYTERGTITVRAEAVEGGQAVRFLVSDTGIGIARDQQAYIFEEFAQIRHPIQQRTKGQGLGLALCQQLAGLLGATITVESQPGKGSTFKVTVPCKPSPATANV